MYKNLLLIVLLAVNYCENRILLGANNVTYKEPPNQHQLNNNTANLRPSPPDGFHSENFLNNPFYQNQMNLSLSSSKDRPPFQNGSAHFRQFQGPINGSNFQQGPPQNFQNGAQGFQNGQQPPFNGSQGPNGFQGNPQQNGQFQGPPGFQNGQQPPPFNGSQMPQGTNGFQGPPPNGQQGFQGPQNGPPVNATFYPPPINSSDDLPVRFKGCSNSSVMANLDTNKLLGKWYALAIWNFGSDFSKITCYRDNFALNGKNISDTRTISYQNKTSANDLNAISNSIKVIDTDYTNFALWVNCNSKSTASENVVVAVRTSNESFYDARLFVRIAYNLNTGLGIPPWKIPLVGRTACSKLN